MSAALTDAEQRLAKLSFRRAMSLAVAGRYHDAMISARAVCLLHPASGAECVELVESFTGGWRNTMSPPPVTA